jgi:hypothetical protein
MPGRRVGTHTTTRPFRCERCHHRGLHPRVTVRPRILEKRLRDGRFRDHANATCSNGHSWWSIHPEAIRLAREANVLALSSLPTGRELTPASPE